jgi:predicted DNA-binding protein
MVEFVPKDDILSVRIPSELNERLKDCASDKNMTVSFLVLSMIRDGLTKYEK